MFYSHEILTSRKHGVATIWLVATLGSNSTLKKVNRKAIKDVDVPKVCEVILTPTVPMALRLQSHLLYGVSRVYSQQCGYVLLDAQNTKNSIRLMLKDVKTPGNDLDPGATKNRPDLLLMQDDPSFVPDLAFALAPDLGLPELHLGTVDGYSPGNSSFLSSHANQLGQSSNGSVPRIRVPISDSPAAGGFGGLGGFDLGGNGHSSSINRSTNQLRGCIGHVDDDMGFLPDAGFGFDADGNIFDIEPGSEFRNIHANRALQLPGSDSAVHERVRREHENARMAEAEGIDFNLDDMPPIDDGYAMLPEAEPFPERNDFPGVNALGSSSVRQAEDEEGSEYAEAAAARKTRKPKIIKLDNTVELRSSVIADWNNNYLTYMEKGLAQKLQRAATVLAKNNADYWIWGSGIGGIGRDAGLLGALDPLAMFYGKNLMERITAFSLSTAGQKRDHSIMEDEAGEREERRVRARSGSIDGPGRGEDGIAFAGDGDGLAPIEYGEDLEMGRNAPTPPPGDITNEVSSVMPWNLSVSQRSSVLQQSRGMRMAHRAGSVSSNAAPDPRRAGRRLTSASPLINRGAGFPDGLSNQDTVDPSVLMRGADPTATSSAFGGGEDFAMPDESNLNTQEEFERFGTTAHVDTQTAHQSQWMRATLDHESTNFLEFVRTACLQQDEEGPGKAETPFIQFETLLPPNTNTKVVAAQGLLHCLSLATKRLLKVDQDKGFGHIVLRLVD